MDAFQGARVNWGVQRVGLCSAVADYVTLGVPFPLWLQTSSCAQRM